MSISISQDLRQGKPVTIVTENGESEEWRLISHPNFTVSSYDTAIQYVSDLGRLARFSGKLVSDFNVDKEGYYRVSIGHVHDIVCYTFHGYPPKVSKGKRYYSVDHIDRDVWNNKASNLRWATLQEQMDNRTYNGKFAKPAKLKKDYVICSCTSKEDLVYESYVYDNASIDEIVKTYSISPGSARNYLYKQFKRRNQDFDCVLQKLGLDKVILEEAYTVMRATQIQREVEKKESKAYTQIIYDALGKTCTDPELAVKCLTTLYQHFFETH